MFKAKYIDKNYAFSIFDHTTMRKKTHQNELDGWKQDGWALALAKISSFAISSMAPKTSTFFDLKTCLRSKAPTVGPHFFETMCPTAFLAPTLTAKTCFICAQPQNAFFLAKLALQGNRSNGKKSFPGRVLGPKKRTKMVPKSGPFQKEFFCSAAKKSPKNWTGPWLSLKMVNGNKFSKWQTLAKCQMFVSRCEPNAAQPNSAVRRSPARKTIESKRDCGGPFI